MTVTPMILARDDRQGDGEHAVLVGCAVDRQVRCRVPDADLAPRLSLALDRGADAALTIDPFFGLLMTILGIAVVDEYVTTGDGSDSPALDTIVALERVRALGQRHRPGGSNRTVLTGISVTMPRIPSPIAT